MILYRDEDFRGDQETLYEDVPYLGATRVGTRCDHVRQRTEHLHVAMTLLLGLGDVVGEVPAG